MLVYSFSNHIQPLLRASEVVRGYTTWDTYFVKGNVLVLVHRVFSTFQNVVFYTFQLFRSVRVTLNLSGEQIGRAHV